MGKKNYNMCMKHLILNRLLPYECLILSALFILTGSFHVSPAYAQQRVDVRVSASQGSCASCDFSRRRMNGLYLRDSNFSYSKFNNSNLSGAQIDRSNLTHTLFRKALLLRVMGADVNLENADFQDATLIEAEIKDSNLQHSLFQHANMQRASFDGSDLTHSNLSGVNAVEANFKACNFTHGVFNFANFEKSILHQALFHNAQLHKTRLKGADLSGADLSGAVLSTAIGLTQAQLDMACGNADTRLPPGLSIKSCPEGKGSVLVAVSDHPRIAAERQDPLVFVLEDAMLQLQTYLSEHPSTRSELKHKLKNLQKELAETRQSLTSE